MTRPMPNRRDTVGRFYTDHPEYFVKDDPPGRHDNQRRKSLPALIDYLEQQHPDIGLWGVLVKTNRGNKIPCDVLVWKPTLEHVDVCDATGGIWSPHGPIDINAGGPGLWFWAPWTVVSHSGDERALVPPPYGDARPEPPPPPDAPDPDSVTLLQAMGAMRDRLDTIHRTQQDLRDRLIEQASMLTALYAELRQLRTDVRTLEVRGGVLWQDVTLGNVRRNEPI